MPAVRRVVALPYAVIEDLSAENLIQQFPQADYINRVIIAKLVRTPRFTDYGRVSLP
jgi:hypothetical protein